MRLGVWKENLVKVIGQNNKSEKRANPNLNPITEKPIKTITDEPTKNGVLDFPQYCRTFSNMIINSPPHFSIGIFGDWGTGKTTLMQMIRDELKEADKKIDQPYGSILGYMKETNIWR